jgi:hypothetical protein
MQFAGVSPRSNFAALRPYPRPSKILMCVIETLRFTVGFLPRMVAPLKASQEGSHLPRRRQIVDGRKFWPQQDHA